MVELPSIIMQTTSKLVHEYIIYVEIILHSKENVNFPYNITCTLMTFYLPILEYVMKGTVSQISYLFILRNVGNKV